jgi:hypothetical protein
VKKHDVTWVSRGRKAECPPNPLFPNGKIVMAHGALAPFCTVDLPYPAACVGTWIVVCSECGLRAVVTAAGRPDDPHQVRIGCKDRR